MSDSIENKLRNISKSVKGPMPTLFNTDNIADVGPIAKEPKGEIPGSPCGVRLSNPTIAIIYDWIIYGIYDRSAGFPVIGGNEGPGQVTTRDPVSPLWERNNPDWNPADPNTWGSVFGPRGEAERFVRHVSCRDTTTNPWSTNCPGLTDADINRMVEELKQLYLIKCGFLVQEGGSCCTFPDFGGAECREVSSAGDCEGVFTAGGNCSGDNPCGGLMPNPIQQNDEMKKQKQVMDMVMSIMKVRKKSTGGCVSQTVNGPLCIASDISREACQAMSDNRYGGQINVWWFNGVPCDMESASRVDYNNGVLMKGEK